MTSRPPTHAGGIVYRMKNGEPEFLLVTARSPRVEWVYPKGHIDPGEDAAEAAVREVEEEAGVRAAIVQMVGDVTVRIGSAEQVVRYFLMTTSEEGEPREGRAYAWLGEADALARLTFPESRDSLRSAIEALPRRPST